MRESEVRLSRMLKKGQIEGLGVTFFDVKKGVQQENSYFFNTVDR